MRIFRRRIHQLNWEASYVAACGKSCRLCPTTWCLSGRRGWVALWAEYAGGVVVDDRNGAADQLRIAGPEPGAILSRAGKQPSSSSGMLPTDEEVNRDGVAMLARTGQI